MKRVAIKDIIFSYKRTGNFLSTARDLGISKWTVRRWVKRSKAASRGRFGDLTTRGLKRLSTRPHTIHSAITPHLENEIVHLRAEEHVGARNSIT